MAASAVSSERAPTRDENMRRLMIPLLATALFTLTPTITTAQETTTTAPQPAPSASPKDPSLGVMLSLLVPGGGQMYAGRPGKGVALLLTGAGGLAIAYAAFGNETLFCSECASSDYNPWPVVMVAAGAGLFLGAWIYGIADAPTQVRRWNQEHGFRMARLQPTISLAHRRTQMGLRIATH